MAPAYVLLASLLLLTLVATAMTAACRLSLGRTVDAEAAERSLQDRWAAISCNRGLLCQCEAVLATGRDAGSAAERAANARRVILLCGRPIELTFGDEQAKVNVGDLLRRSGRSEAENVIRELLSGTGLAGRVHLTPALPAHAPLVRSALTMSEELAAGNYGNLLEPITPAELLGERHGIACPAEIVTCWGDGRLNWQRASERAMRQVLSPPLDLSQVAALISLRDRPRTIGMGRMSLSDALDAVGLRTGQRAAAARRLSDGSACHSLWVVTTGGRGVGPRTYREYVLDESRLPAAVSGFEW